MKKSDLRGMMVGALLFEGLAGEVSGVLKEKKSGEVYLVERVNTLQKLWFHSFEEMYPVFVLAKKKEARIIGKKYNEEDVWRLFLSERERHTGHDTSDDYEAFLKELLT